MGVVVVVVVVVASYVLSVFFRMTACFYITEHIP